MLANEEAAWYLGSEAKGQIAGPVQELKVWGGGQTELKQGSKSRQRVQQSEANK